MDKSPDAFRTISEVAEELDLPQHVLRFWETRFTQIKPLKRGGGRRYYRPSDVDLLKGIRHLLYEEGYTIKGVQKILRENGNQFAIAIGVGDMSALEEMTKRSAQPVKDEAASPKVEPEPEPEKAPVEDIVIGHSQPKPRGLFGLGKSSPAEQVVESGSGPISRDNRALLQEALFDLLECKRLLDQSR